MALDITATPNIVEAGSFMGKTLWAFTGADTDVSTAIDIVAAPGAGLSLYITAVILTSNDVDSYPRLQDGDGTLLFGPFYTALTSGTAVVISKEFKNPIKVTANKSLALKTAAAGDVSVWVEGFTAAG